MKIRLGFVAMSLELEDASPSKTVTYKSISKIPDHDVRIRKLERLTKENLQNTLRVLRHAYAHRIEFYRFTSKLVPLATHEVAEGWDYVSACKAEFESIGTFVKENNMRVGLHPDHFTVINSPKEDVFQKALADLEYHDNILQAMNLDESAKLVLHVGGKYGSKEPSIERFMKNFRTLPERIQNRIILENDDKIYTANDVLSICRQLDIPMVLDFHHHRCNPGETVLSELLPNIMKTWPGELQPKMHLSSPKNEKDFRSHADDIGWDDFSWIIHQLKPLDMDADIMLEAKNKDLAVLHISEAIKKNTDWQLMGNGIVVV